MEVLFEEKFSYISDMKFHPKKDLFLVCSLSRSDVEIWDINIGKKIAIFSCSEPVTSMSFDSKGDTVLFGHYCKRISLWDFSNQQLICSVKSENMKTIDIAYTYSFLGDVFVTVGTSFIEVWKVENRKIEKLWMSNIHFYPVERISFSQNKYFSTMSFHQTFCWDLELKKNVEMNRSLEKYKTIHALIFGSYSILGIIDEHWNVILLVQEKEILIGKHNHFIDTLVFDSQLKILAMADNKNNIVVYDVEKQKKLQSIKSKCEIYKISWGLQKLATIDSEYCLTIWKTMFAE